MKKGRKKMTINKLKAHQVKARFSEEDYKCVLKKASQCRLKPSVFVARAATSVVIKEPLTKDVLSDMKNLVSIGINLNQIAKKINSNPLYSCHEQLNREIHNLSTLRQILLNKLTNE